MAFLFAVFFLIPIMLAFAGFIFSFFILDFGIDGIFLDNLRGRDTTLKIRKIRSYSICWASFLRFFYLALWAMLFFFPAVVKYYSYIFVPYIVRDNPGIGADEAINLSCAMMNGRKMELFCLHLSFLKWAVLATIPLGIGWLWLYPYIKATQAAFYMTVYDEYNGIPQK